MLTRIGARMIEEEEHGKIKKSKVVRSSRKDEYPVNLFLIPTEREGPGSAKRIYLRRDLMGKS